MYGAEGHFLVRYFDDRARYADLINGFIFCGEQVVSEEDVQEMDSNVTGVFGRLREPVHGTEIRDCVRKIVFDTGFAIVGIENQDRSIMPCLSGSCWKMLRVMTDSCGI